MMAPKERIEFIVENCAGGSLARFSADTKIEASVACRIRSGKVGKSKTEGLGNFAERIYRAYPYLNAAWLLTGEGDPFQTEDTPVISSILSRLTKLEKTIQTLTDKCEV